MLPRAHRQFCLAEACQAAGFNVKLITVEVGSRGLIDTTQFSELGTVLEVSHKRISHLFTSIIRTTVMESHIVQNAAGERPSYKGQLSMEKCCSQMAKVRRTLYSLTPRSILSLPLFHSPSFSLSPFLPHFLSVFCLWSAEREV